MRKIIISMLVLVLLSVGIISLLFGMPAEALSGSDFRADYIIDDTIFFNPNLVGGVNEIQTFLNSKVPVCATNHTSTNADNQPPFICLKDFRQDTPNRPSEPNLCGAYSGGNKSAAQIIFDVGQACNINPGALIVLLQKEQALVTDDWPWAIQYRSATGFGCPDTAPCDSDYYGFFNQLYNAARQFRYYKLHPDYFQYRAGRNNNVLYNPNSACGSSTVFIQNPATAGLYSYTPYQPNQAALNNLYGTGDGCSAYGNRNFWRLFNEWFGSTQTNAKISVEVLDGTTDKSGKAARIGLRLNQRPVSTVAVSFMLSNTAIADFSSQSTVNISPDNWDNAAANQVVIYGKNSTTVGADYYTLKPSSVASGDPQFRLLTAEFVPSVTLANLDNNGSAVYRLFSSSTGKHVYTSNLSERSLLTSQGFSDEGIRFYSCASGDVSVARIILSGTTQSLLTPLGSGEYKYLTQNGYSYEVSPFSASNVGTVPVYRLYSKTTQDHFYTISVAEKDAAVSQGMSYEGTAFNSCASTKKPVYRLRNNVWGTYLFTQSPQERDIAGAQGYSREGIAFYLDPPTDSSLPAYRLFGSPHPGHFFTTSIAERDTASSSGLTKEGVGFYSEPQTASSVPVYRLLNPASGGHLFTIHKWERDSAINSGYASEGVGFYINQ